MRFCRNCYKNKIKANLVTYEYCRECQEKNAKLTEEELRVLYKKLHETTSYGISADYVLHFMEPIIQELAPTSLLDFGCGQSKFADILNVPELITRVRYDFAIPKHSNFPEETFDLVTCFDVMEHIPEGVIDSVLSKIKSKSDNALFKISCTIAGSLLEGGMNAHCTLKTTPEWMAILQQYFPRVNIIPYGNEKAEFICKTW